MDSKARRKKSFLIFSAVIVFSLITWVSVIVFKDWSEPLSPSLDLPTPEPTEVVLMPVEEEPLVALETPIATLIPDESPSAEPEAPETEVISMSPQVGEPSCGGPEDMLILAVAADAGNETYLYGRADAIRLIYADFVTPRVVFFAIPKDLWVEIPDISDHYGITHGKLSEAYLYGNPGMGYYDGPGGGPGLLARTLAHNFGVYVDHYGAISMQTFIDIVDTMGGIDVYLDEDIEGTFEVGLDDYYQEFAHFTAGMNRLDGEDALALTRMEGVDAIIGRQERQSRVILALRDQVLSVNTARQFSKLIKAFEGRTQTDLSKQQLLQLSCLITQLKPEDIVFETLPDDCICEAKMFSERLNGYLFALEADPVEVSEIILAQFESP